MTVALCPGSFDPPTLGHVDVIERAIDVFDQVIVSVVDNPAKESLFSAEERVELLKRLVGDRARVVAFSGLLVEHVSREEADIVVKGLRSIDDYEYEKQMSQMNRHLTGMETVFMATEPAHSFLSSSLVKEVAKLGGDISDLVPVEIAEALKERFA